MLSCFAATLPASAPSRLRALAPCALLLSLAVAAPAQQTVASLDIAPLPESPSASLDPGIMIVRHTTGSITGIIRDSSGATVAGARIALTYPGSTRTELAETDADGAFVLTGLQPGAYKLTVTAAGLDAYIDSGAIARGEDLKLPPIDMALASANTAVEVTAGRTEIATAQLHLAEQQRVLGVIPNFYATYIWNAAPLTRRQKFSLAWKFVGDPVNLGMAAVVAGTEQSSDTLSGYGQGTRGYARRFGATYADGFSSTMLGQAILPSLLHQDPRYFVKGTGSSRSRALYSISTVVICKGDNGRWQPNYSNVLGNLAASAISNIYYPASSRHGAASTIQNSLIGTAFGATGNLIQEFLLHHITPHLPNYNATN